MTGPSTASVSYADFGLDHHIARASISSALKLLDHLGLIEIEPRLRLVNVFNLSNRWRTPYAVEALRLAEVAREPKPPRTLGKPPTASLRQILAEFDRDHDRRADCDHQRADIRQLFQQAHKGCPDAQCSLTC